MTIFMAQALPAQQTVAANEVQRRGSVRNRIKEYEQERRAKAEAAAAKRVSRPVFRNVFAVRSVDS